MAFEIYVSKCITAKARKIEHSRLENQPSGREKFRAQKYLEALFLTGAIAPNLSLNPLTTSQITLQLKAVLPFLKQQTNSDRKHMNCTTASLHLSDMQEHLCASKFDLTELPLSLQ